MISSATKKIDNKSSLQKSKSSKLAQVQDAIRYAGFVSSEKSLLGFKQYGTSYKVFVKISSIEFLEGKCIINIYTKVEFMEGVSYYDLDFIKSLIFGKLEVNIKNATATWFPTSKILLDRENDYACEIFQQGQEFYEIIHNHLMKFKKERVMFRLQKSE